MRYTTVIAVKILDGFANFENIRRAGLLLLLVENTQLY